MTSVTLHFLTLIVNQRAEEDCDPPVAPGPRLTGATCSLVGSLSLTTTDAA